MKKIKSFLLLALGLIVTQNVLAAVGDEFTVNGVQYKITQEGTAANRWVSIIGCSDETTTISITSTVTNKNAYRITQIADDAFKGKNLTSIDLTNATYLTSIGSSAFDGCTNLTSITVPGSVTTIADNVFAGKTVNIAGNITSTAFANSGVKIINMTSGTTIAANAFNGCTSLESITLSSALNTINANAFDRCTNLAEIYLPTTVTAAGIAANAFQGYTGKVIVNNNNTRASWFQGSAISEVEINAGTNIPASTFSRCTNLKTVTLAGSITTINDNAFDGCSSLTNIDLTKVTRIGDYAFRGTGLTNVDWKLNSVSQGCFQNCTKLESINLPSSITTINANAFDGCTNLKGNIDFPDLATIGANAFDNTGIASISVNKTTTNAGTSVAQNAFQNYPGKVIVNVATVGNWFSGSAAKQIELSDKVTSITMTNARNNYSVLEKYKGELIIKCATPLVNNNQSNAFLGNNNTYSSVIIDAETTGLGTCWKVNTNTANDEYLSVTITENVKTLGDKAFLESTIKEITIPGTLKTIPLEAFYHCTELTDVTLEEGVTTLMKDVFNGCTKLENVSLPNTLETIGWGAFYGSGIKKIEIPNSVTSIEQHSFGGCAQLQEITIPSSVTTMEPEVFLNSTKLTTVVIDAQISTLPSGTFSGCTGLTNITLPATLTQINKDDFKDCTKLTNVTLNSLPEGLENLPNGVTITLELSDDKGLNDIQNVTKTVAISYTRSINASTNWGSLVLPFNCTSNDDIQLYQFAGADLDKGFIKFEEVESVAANTPCFFKKKISNATSVSFNATLSGGFSVGITPSTSEGWTMTGSYARTTINSNEYFISSDKLYYANSNVTMKPFRGWLVAPANAAASLRTLTIQIVETDATGVEHIVNETEINEQDIYDLFGRHLTTPQRGINIVNGKKVMVK